VRYREHGISQVLDLTIEEALALFKDVPAAHSRLQLLYDVGLGYLPLGHPATMLSGGEDQRVKLAKELGRRTGQPHSMRCRHQSRHPAPRRRRSSSVVR